MKLVKCSSCEEKFDPSKHERCPECGVHYLPKRSQSGLVIHQHPLGYAQCDWRAADERCRYPGTMSAGLLGEGPWYCSGHFGCSNPVMGADIVQASRDYRHPTREQTQDSAQAKVQAEAAAYCQERGLDSAAKMRAFARKPVGGNKPGDGLDWARKIMARIKAGEKLPIISERMAREALEIAEKERGREPGEDESEQDPRETVA